MILKYMSCRNTQGNIEKDLGKINEIYSEFYKRLLTDRKPGNE